MAFEHKNWLNNICWNKCVTRGSCLSISVMSISVSNPLGSSFTRAPKFKTCLSLIFFSMYHQNLFMSLSAGYQFSRNFTRQYYYQVHTNHLEFCFTFLRRGIKIKQFYYKLSFFLLSTENITHELFLSFLSFASSVLLNR